MWTTLKKLYIIQQMIKYRQDNEMVTQEMAHLLDASFADVCGWENESLLPHDLMCDKIAAILGPEYTLYLQEI